MSEIEEDDYDFIHNDSPVCPYCKFSPHWDDYFEQVSFEDGNIDEIDCSECKHTYLVETNVVHYFNTMKKEETS